MLGYYLHSLKLELFNLIYKFDNYKFRLLIKYLEILKSSMTFKQTLCS